MRKQILIIGSRRLCTKAALDLGYEVVLWSSEPVTKKRKNKVHGFMNFPYEDNKRELTHEVTSELKKYEITRVVANTEETVLLGALVRKHLKLKRLAVDVTERFQDKWVMKNKAKEVGVPITKYSLINENTKAEDLVKDLGLPLVIKPVDDSGAHDVRVVEQTEDVAKWMKPGLLAEAFVEGSEVSVETFIEDGKPVFHNITEYLHQWKKSVAPAHLPKDLESKILELNDKVITSFGVDRGMTHAEFYLTKAGPVFGEIALRPPGGYYMNLIERVYGFKPWEAFVKLSCGEKVDFLNCRPQGCAAVYTAYPEAGEIKSIEGADEIKSRVKGVFDFSIRKKVGDVVPARDRTSNEVAHILFWAETREELNADLKFIEASLLIETE